MKNKSKTNWKIDENTTEKFNRYGIRKYNVGAASVAILSGLFFLGGADAQAAETGSSQTAAQAVATESGSSATANKWEKAITTVVEKEKSTNVAATGTENKPVDTVAPKAETREANAARAAVSSTEGYSGFRAAGRRGPSRPAPSQPTNHPAATPTNTVNASAGATTNHNKVERLRLEDAIEPTDISNGTHAFRGEGSARGAHPIHYDVTTTRRGNGIDVSINYQSPGSGEFVRNNFILHTGNGFAAPQLRSVSGTNGNPSIVKGQNFMSHSGYTLASSVDTRQNQLIKFFLPFSNVNGDLSFRLQPTTFNVNQGGGSEATINDPYSNSNYYFKERPLYLDANPTGGAAGRRTFTEAIDFQTIYLPTTKLAEGETKKVRDGVNGERQITYKVHKFGEETVLGLPISNTISREAQPRIVQIGVAKDLVEKPEVVKPRVDQNKVGDTNHLTFYLDKDGNSIYNEGVDELIQNIDIKDGAKGEKGDRGERGLTGAQGAKGEKGDRGERGLTGAQGAKGEKGDRGERGLTGAQGAKGEKGDQGERGLTGAQGAKGEKGDRGERGLTGAKGEKGDQGERGLTGAQGAKGEKGDRGERGLTGAQGAKGEKGDQGERGLTGEAGRDGVTPTVTVKDNKADGTHTITINDGRGNVTNTVVRDGFDGKSPLVATNRNEEAKTTTVIFYYDENGNNELDNSDKKLKEVVIADGAKGEKGDKGATPKVTTARGADGRSTDITFTVPGEEPVVANIKDGKDGRTPTIDLNALAEAAIRINNQRSGRVRRALADAPSTAPASQPVEGTRITAYYDNNGNGKYDPGVDELIGTSDILNGTNGRNGADGASGADGRNGAELLSGADAPTAKDGKDGDTYIDATTGDVYKKEGENWKQIGNIRGPQGLKGDKGQDGIQGPQGPKGDKGEQGLQGRDGREGVQGLPGRDGRDGPQGPAGRDGRDGKDVLNGKVNPEPTQGKDGDKYVNTETGDVFVKNNGTWEKEGNIKGPKGDKGEKGLQGRDGQAGAQGPAGRDGRDGAAGRDGRDGRDGKDVLNGKVNPEPTQGKDGDKYVNTETGDVFVKNNGTWEKEGNIKGPKGDKGEKGLQGERGQDGAQGPRGPQGEVGPQGSQGLKGEKGEDGKTPEVTVKPGKDGNSSDITFTVPGKDPVTVNVKNGENGLNGKTPKVDLLRVEGQNGNPSHTIVTFYTDENGDGKYTPGTDELLGSEMIKDGAKGADGRDGKSLIAVKTGTETKVYQEDPANPGQPLNPEKPLAVIKDGLNGVSPTVTAVRKEDGNKGVEITIDNHDGSQPTKVLINDGAKGEAGQDGNTPTVTTQRGADGRSTIVTFTTPGKDPVSFVVKDGKDGRTPHIDLNALAEALRRGAGLAVNPQPSTSPRSARRARSVGDNPDEVPAPATTDATGTQPATTDSQPATTDSQPVEGTRITAYYDNNGNGKYDPGVDELIGTSDILNGTNGRNGTNGASGADGRNGAELLSGVTAPTAKDGKDGDTFIDANTGDVYKKENGSWNKIGNIRGPQGVAGEKGEKGDKGENGANGADGKSPVVNVTDNGDGTHSITVRNPDGSESTTKVKDGKDGKTANITTKENPDGSHTITVTNPDGSTKETVVKNGKDGKTPKVEVTDNNDGTHTVKVTDGDGNVTNAIIKDGKDGKAATATTTENPDGSHTVTITNPDGTKNEFVVKNGRDGVDGRTPTASVRDNRDGSHTIVITNPEGVTTETTVRDGKSPKVTITDEQNGTHKITVLNGDGTTTETIIKDGKSPVATVRDNQDGTYTIRVENGNGTVSETTVRDGKSPTAKVVDNGDGTHTVTIVNSDGTTTTTTVRDGKSPKLEVIDNNNGSHTIKVTGADGKETNTTIFDGKSPKANIVDNGDGTHTLTIVDSDGREYKSVIKDGKDGKDGVSPTVTVKNNNDGTHTVTITNPDGSKTDMVIKDGKDGKSPKVSVEDNGDGSHTITIINSDGSVTKTVVKDGKDGRDGKDGKDGRDGKDGNCGCNDKPVPPVNNNPAGPTFAMPVPPVHELPEYTGGVTPLDPPVYDKPEFNGGVPGMPEVTEVPELKVPEVPVQPTPEKPTPEVPVQPMPEKPVTPENGTVPPVKVSQPKAHARVERLAETGEEGYNASIYLGGTLLFTLFLATRRKED